MQARNVLHFKGGVPYPLSPGTLLGVAVFDLEFLRATPSDSTSSSHWSQ